jgi:hypothetical protein
MRINWGNRSTRRKHDPLPLCPPQIPNDSTWDWAWEKFFFFLFNKPNDVNRVFNDVLEENTDSIVRVDDYTKDIVSNKQATSKTSENFYRTRRRTAPEDMNLYSHRSENSDPKFWLNITEFLQTLYLRFPLILHFHLYLSLPLLYTE